MDLATDKKHWKRSKEKLNQILCDYEIETYFSNEKAKKYVFRDLVEPNKNKRTISPKAARFSSWGIIYAWWIAQ